MNNYDVDYFLAKFQSIPEDKVVAFTQDDRKGGHCAYGWCAKPDMNGWHYSGNDTSEGKALQRLLGSIPNLKAHNTSIGPYYHTPARINNGEIKQYQQDTPKQRILAALHDVKRLQESTDKSGDKAVEEADEIISTPLEEPEVA